jgi:cell division protein FtsB
MNNRSMIPGLAVIALLAGAFALFGSASAEAQCLSQSECDALKAQLQQHREDAKPKREEIKRIREQARGLPRGSEERKAMRRQARQLRRDFRYERRAIGIREVMNQYRDGCKRC